MIEEVEIDSSRFITLLSVLRFLEKNNADLMIVEKDHRPYMSVRTFALMDKKNRRVDFFLQESLRDKRYFYTEGEND